MGRPLKVSLTTNLLFILAIMMLGGLFILAQLPPGGPDGVAAVTTRGGRMFVVRFPASSTSPQHQIEVFDSSTSPRPRIAIFEAVNARDGDPYHEVQLTDNQWQAIEGLRQQWCRGSPAFLPSVGDPPQYAIGLRCEAHGLRSSRQVMIPADELPRAIRDLIVLFPMPAR
jgi:hypothetical protein